LFVSAEEAPSTATSADATEKATESAAPVLPSNAEGFSFQSDVSRVLDIVIHSLYQHSEIFLREPIFNASDALDKIRFLLLTHPKYKTDRHIPLQVQIEYDADADAETLTIRDTGVGMTKEEMVKNVGTVARSGIAKFIDALKESGNTDSTIQ
jgi:heat shock protein beta